MCVSIVGNFVQKCPVLAIVVISYLVSIGVTYGWQVVCQQLISLDQLCALPLTFLSTIGIRRKVNRGIVWLGLTSTWLWSTCLNPIPLWDIPYCLVSLAILQ